MRLGRLEEEAIGGVVGIMGKVGEKLREHGITMDVSGDMEACCDPDGSPKIKVVCVSPDLHDKVEEMKGSAREVVVMARVDEATSRTLDAWVEAGAVRSRSEAAALFIREGLGVRSAELARLGEALRSVEEAKSRRRRQAMEVFGEERAKQVPARPAPPEPAGDCRRSRGYRRRGRRGCQSPSSGLRVPR